MFFGKQEKRFLMKYFVDAFTEHVLAETCRLAVETHDGRTRLCMEAENNLSETAFCIWSGRENMTWMVYPKGETSLRTCH